MTIRTLSASALAATLLITPIAAQQHHGAPQAGHGAAAPHAGHGAAAPADTPATAAFKAANAAMHRDMDIAFSGDPDVDFVKGMIPHHNGAVDMAKVLIGFGKDPELRKLAEEIVAAQEKEIAFMREWLKRREATRVKP